MISYQFNLEVTPGSMPPILHMAQYDTGRTYTANLKNNGVAFTPTQGSEAKIKGRNAAGVCWEQEATVSGSTVEFTPEGAATDQFGIMPVQLELYKGDVILSTLLMVFDIQRAGYTNEEAVRSPEFETAIEEAVQTALGNTAVFSYAAKQALLDLLEHVAYTDNQGREYLDDLETELLPPGVVSSISAEFTQGTTTIWDTDSLDDLKSMLVVTAYYDASTSREVDGYTLSGTLTAGECEITVTYYGKTTTFTVIVTHSYVPAGYRQCEYIENSGNAYITTGVTVGSTTLKIATKYYRASQVSAEEAIAAGNIGGGSAGFEIGLSSTTNRLFAFSATSAQIVDALVYGDVNDLEVVFKPSSPYASMKLTSGETELTGTKTTANNSSLASAKLDIFHTGDGNANFKGRIYGFSLHKDTDTAVFIGYPCYRMSDNVAGLYDTVSGAFFPSNGSAQFSKGADL